MSEEYLEPIFKSARELGRLTAKINFIKAALDTPMSAKKKIEYIERILKPTA